MKTTDGGVFLEHGPKNEVEAHDENRVNDVVKKIMAQAQQRRRVLNLQELCDMDPCFAKFEQHFPDIDAYFFSVSGRLRGEQIDGAMFAGNVMLIFAESLEKARYTAESGLRDTRHHANEFAHLSAQGIDPIEKMDREHGNAGAIVDAGGNRIRKHDA